MSTIDISDLHTASLISALWSNILPNPFFSLHSVFNPSPPSDTDINTALAHSKYIDYLAGRCIKTDFSDLTKVDTSIYNRHAGPNAFEIIVARMICKGSAN